jgi:hypothetical protein
MSVLLGIGSLLTGCIHYEIPEYEPVALDLDGKSELHISTYPAGYPRTTSSIPFLYKAERSPESVFFQVFVRDKQKKVGPNAHVKSIRIHSFSYQLDNDALVVLMSQYDDHFWMQDQPNYNKGERTPVPWVSGKPLAIEVSLTLNGKDYALKTRMQPVARKRTGSLVADTLLR